MIGPVNYEDSSGSNMMRWKGHACEGVGVACRAVCSTVCHLSKGALERNSENGGQQTPQLRRRSSIASRSHNDISAKAQEA